VRGEVTRFEYEANPSGRLFLVAVNYGGWENEPLYKAGRLKRCRVIAMMKTAHGAPRWGTPRGQEHLSRNGVWIAPPKQPSPGSRGEPRSGGGPHGGAVWVFPPSGPIP